MVLRDVTMAERIDNNTIASHSCDANQFRWYNSNDADTVNSSIPTSTSETESGLSIIGIALGVSAFATLLFVAILCRLRLQRAVKQSQVTSKQSSKSIPTVEAAIRGQTGLWSDDIITAKRIPRDKVVTGELISRGSFGEVYAGTFNGRQVAVKILLPATREKLHRVNSC